MRRKGSKTHKKTQKNKYKKTTKNIKKIKGGRNNTVKKFTVDGKTPEDWYKLNPRIKKLYRVKSRKNNELSLKRVDFNSQNKSKLSHDPDNADLLTLSKRENTKNKKYYHATGNDLGRRIDIYKSMNTKKPEQKKRKKNRTKKKDNKAFGLNGFNEIYDNKNSTTVNPLISNQMQINTTQMTKNPMLNNNRINDDNKNSTTVKNPMLNQKPEITMLEGKA